MTTNQALYLQAESSIQAYDAYVFAAVGRSFDANKADLLAASAVHSCEVASRDRSGNQVTRDYYRSQAVLFRNILGA